MVGVAFPVTSQSERSELERFMHVSKILLICIGAMLALIARVDAQEFNSGLVKGIVAEQLTKMPLQFVNVALRKTSDSTIVTGQTTDSLGRFSIRDIPSGDYYLSYQIIGYQPKQSPAFRFDPEHTLIDLGKIKLETASLQMDEVEVSAEKLLYTTTIDRKVYNVERDLVNKAGSASELLQNVPSVQVDIDGNVSLRGSSNVLIMVNGRTSPMMNKNSATVLEQMPANTIERVELITNPSAEFKPDAAAGIINIVMKKNALPGINGSLAGNAGNSDRYNSTLSASYNPGHSNIFASYAIRRNNRNRYSNDSRRQADTTFTFYNQAVNSQARPLSHTVTAGGDYRLNPQNQIGLSGSYFYNTFDRMERNENYLFDARHDLTSSYLRNRIQSQVNKETEFTAFYERSFAEQDHSLRCEVTSARSPETEDNHFTNIYRYPVSPVTLDRSLLIDSENSTQVTVEYNNPLSEQTTIKAGYEAEFNRSDFDFRVDNFDTTQQQYVKDVTKTSRFLHSEDIHAVFGTYQRSFGKFGALAGLRGEYAAVSSDLKTLDSTMSGHYFNLYPSLHLSYALGKPTELQLSYSKRTRRPETDDLNPFPEYNDPRNIRSGNPRLRPEYIHSVELGCQYHEGKVTLLPAFFYRYTYNRFTWVTRALNDSVLFTTHENLSNDQSGGLELNVSAASKKLVSLHGNASVFQSQIDASNLNDGKKSVITWASNMTLDLTLSETTRLQLSSNYRSRQLTATGSMSPSYSLNGGFRQEFVSGKIVFLATITDIFHTQKRRFNTDTPALQETSNNWMDSRIVYAGLTYHFGTQQKKSHDDQIRYEEGQ
jgi:outer membrane receptor protein involved in Fe transport